MIFGKKETWRGKRRGKLLTIQISDELYTRVEEIRKKYGISRSQFIRDAIMEKITRLEKSE